MASYASKEGAPAKRCNCVDAVCNSTALIHYLKKRADAPDRTRAAAHPPCSCTFWERAKHRAEFYAKVGFPDSHPLRHAVDQISRDLEGHRCAADRTVAEIVRKYGEFWTLVNGSYFEDATDWFRSGNDIYWDCPDIVFGRGVRRSNKLYLAGVASIHDLEMSGRAFIAAVDNLAETAPPKAKRDLVRTAEVFDKDCQRFGAATEARQSVRARSPGHFAVPPARRRAERAGSVGVRVHCLNFEPVAPLGERAIVAPTAGATASTGSPVAA